MSTVACCSESSSAPPLSAHLRHQRRCKDEIQDLTVTGRAPAASRRSRDICSQTPSWRPFLVFQISFRQTASRRFTVEVLIWLKPPLCFLHKVLLLVLLER